ncbi:MAG: TIGR00296 family protein [Nanoarchaeota archaeon]
MNIQERGQFALKIARQAIEKWVREKDMLVPAKCPEEFKEKGGVFVTITKNDNLRGCIGYPEPVKPLIDALIDAAIQATMDPRFSELGKTELDEIKIEVSILTKPELIESSPEEYIKNIEIGKDGLIAESGYNRGLLLPQVATEHGMSSEEFLSQTCMKAGLKADAWKSKDVKMYKFQAQIFHE